MRSYDGTSTNHRGNGLVLQLSSRCVAEPAQVRRRSCGANLATPMLLADSLTMCQTAFTVIPSPQVLPTLLTRRNSLPRSIATAASQSSSSALTQSGTGTVRMWPPLPTRSTMAQCSSRCWRMIPMSKPRLHASSSHTPVAMRARLGHAFLSVAHDRGLAKAHCLALLLNQLPRRMPSFFTL